MTQNKAFLMGNCVLYPFYVSMEIVSNSLKIKTEILKMRTLHTRFKRLLRLRDFEFFQVE